MSAIGKTVPHLPSPDQSQRAFIESPATNVRLLAPAGCGKTLSLLLRCAHVAKKGTPQRIRFLIVTFTIAAKQELASRLNSEPQFDGLRDNVEITTLNSWGYRRIKNTSFNAKLLTEKKDYHFAMLNQLQPIWRQYERVCHGIEQAKYMAPRKLLNLIDDFKTLGFDHERDTNFELFAERLASLRAQGLAPRLENIVDELARLQVLPTRVNRSGEEKAKSDDRELYNSFFRFWRDASASLISTDTYTLEDQKYVAFLDERQKFEDGKLLTGAARYDHVMVDEFQDINPLDLALIRAIVGRNRATLTIVGDDDQALFEWRGATPEYILNPGKYFDADFATYTLSVNYRSPHNIVESAQELISHNTRRVAKEIRAHQNSDAEIEVVLFDNLSESMENVLEDVTRAVSEGKSPSRIAIIGRKRSQLIPYQVYFASKEISFCAAEDLQVFMSDAFDRLLKMLMIKGRSETRQMRSQVIDDLLELCNVVKRYPLSRADREGLRKYLSSAGVSNLNQAVEALHAYRGSLKGANDDGRISGNMADAVREFLQASTVSNTLFAIGDNFRGLQLDMGKAEDDIFFADPPFLHLAEYATGYDTDHFRFVEDIEKAKEQLAYLPPFEDDSATASADELWRRPIHLMTALRAKGKEFDFVILLDVNDGIWPNKNCHTPEEKEAERRVFYVAFTRARKRLLISSVRNYAGRPMTPSPYIGELGFVFEGEE